MAGCSAVSLPPFPFVDSFLSFFSREPLGKRLRTRLLLLPSQFPPFEAPHTTSATFLLLQVAEFLGELEADGLLDDVDCGSGVHKVNESEATLMSFPR